MNTRWSDVTTSIKIDRPLAEVAAYAGDPSNAPQWYANIQSVEWETPPSIAVGSRLRFVASFLGRTLRYSYEVAELAPSKRLVMATALGPFPMESPRSPTHVRAGPLKHHAGSCSSRSCGSARTRGCTTLR